MKIEQNDPKLQDIAWLREVFGVAEEPPTGDDVFQLLVMLAPFVGNTVDELARISRIPLQIVQNVAENMKESRIWVGSGVDWSEWLDVDTGDVDLAGLALHAMVARGDLVRTGRKSESGKWIYRSKRRQ